MVGTGSGRLYIDNNRWFDSVDVAISHQIQVVVSCNRIEVPSDVVHDLECARWNDTFSG